MSESQDLSHLFCFLDVCESSIHPKFCSNSRLEHVLSGAHHHIIDYLPFPGCAFPKVVACGICRCLRLASIEGHGCQQILITRTVNTSEQKNPLEFNFQFQRVSSYEGVTYVHLRIDGESC